MQSLRMDYTDRSHCGDQTATWWTPPLSFAAGLPLSLGLAVASGPPYGFMAVRRHRRGGSAPLHQLRASLQSLRTASSMYRGDDHHHVYGVHRACQVGLGAGLILNSQTQARDLQSPRRMARILSWQDSTPWRLCLCDAILRFLKVRTTTTTSMGFSGGQRL